MKQTIVFGRKARRVLLKGTKLTAKAVSVTLGPKGRNCITHKINGTVRSTKDGISVINEIRPDNPLLNAGVKLLRACSQKTADEAGDSTTSTAILANYMMTEANKLLNRGYNSVTLRKGIEKATQKCIEWVKLNARPINGDAEKIRAISTISANNNTEIGDLIAEAFTKLGETGEITLEDSKTDQSQLELLGGYHFPKGMVSPYFITNQIKGVCELEAPLILLYDKRITKVQDLLSVLEFVIKGDETPRSLLIICATCEQEALGTLIANKLKGNLQVCVVFAPEQGIKRADIMEDIAIFTGGKVVSEEQGTALDKTNFKPEFLGEALKVIVKKDSCLIVNGQGNPDDVETRQKQIKEMISEAPSDYEKEYLRKRAGSIGRGVAVLYIGAPTEIEKGDKKDLAEDAILAARAAIEEGYLPGGGVGFIRCANDLKGPEKLTAGEQVVLKALYQPLKQLLKNNGIYSPFGRTSIEKKVISGKEDFGYNAKTEQFGQLISEGVIDASKVIRCAIENAASVTQMFISTEVLVSEIPDEQSKAFQKLTQGF